MKRERKLTSAFTMVEMLISMTVAMMAFFMVYNFMSGTRSHLMYGTVNLQNLQDARLAINFLRRDFSSACPKFVPDGANSYKAVQSAQKQIFGTSNNLLIKEVGKSSLIQIGSDYLQFYKFRFDQNSSSPSVEEVQYNYDSNNKILKRQVGTKFVEFHRIEGVQFKLYCHNMNPDIPLLHVTLRVHEGKREDGKKEYGKELEITTSITSKFVNSCLRDLNWNYGTYQN